MNKVIEELAVKSGFSETYGLQEKERLSKFAQLIVRECARVAFATAIGDGSPDEIHDAIKETFRS